MACTSCGRENPGGARFCGGCGAALVRHCPACGTDAAPDARFCVACGASLGARAAEASVARKMVTVVFADLIGSVSLHERLDAESVRRLMDRYHRTMAAAVERHGGRVVQLLGDGVLAAFGVPRVAEDDAVRAVRAGVEMQSAYRALVRELGAPLADVGLRVAVNTGEVVVGDDETAVIGDPTNVAARLQHEAHDGDVIVGESTQPLVAEHVTLAPLGTFALRGRAEAVDAYRVVSLERPASARATPFVGRDAELRRLWSAYDDAIAAPGARLAVLLASPGLGKSRLLGELERRAGQRATVLSARCDAAGGATFAPIADALRAHLRLGDGSSADALRAALATLPAADDAERARIAAGVGALVAGTPAAPEETFFAVRRLLAVLAAERPVVLSIDDVHWAEPLLLDLVEHLVQWSAGVPLLIVVAARPELRDLRPSLTVPGGTVSELVTLGALDAGAATRLAAAIAGGAELPAALVGRVLAASEGHPLFLAELVRMLVQDGTLRRDGDRWVTTVELAKLDMPPTIQVLLAARIERLAPDERAVLERAAVIGRQFSRGAVAHLLPDVEDLDARIAALERSELIEPDPARHLGEPALRFHHVLIRDAAYRRVLKETRAELHERLADWIAARGGDGTEHEETLGWHLEQAHQNLRELGPLDARGRGLGERAARHLGAAGSRALAREDLALAASLLGRAIDALEPEHPLRAELAPDWCEALLAAGEVGAAARAIDELERSAGDSARLRAWHVCFAAQLATLTDPQSLRPTAARVADAAGVLAAAGDAAGEAKAHAVHAGVLARLGAIGASEAALDKALAAARRARDRRRANAVLAGAPVAALWGPSPVTRASGRCLDVVRVLRITQGAPAVEAVALRCQAVLETLRGRGEAARRMIASSRRMVEELGIAQQVLDADAFAGIVELLEGDPVAAESCLRTAYDGLRARGLAIDAARAAALLGRALLAQGRVPEAEELSRASETLAGDDLKAAIAWRGVRAEALARRGETEAALALARASVEIAAGTDALLDHADARVALATALRAAGRDAEADDEQRRAIDLWNAKGAAVLVARAGRPPGAGVALDCAAAPAAREQAAHDVAPGADATSALRAVLPNAATAEVARLDAAVAARDLAAIERLFEAVVEIVHHPLETTYDRAGAVASFRMLFRVDDVHFHDVPIATLGESLALCHQRVTCGGLARRGVDVGLFEGDQLWLSEVDAQGRRVHAESFAKERLNDAVATLFRRHAALEPDGARREAAARTARMVASLMGLDDFEQSADLFAADAIVEDHRVLGLGSLRGRDAVLVAARSLHRHARDVTTRVEELFVVRPDALFLRSVTYGTERAGGARFELPAFQIRFFDADGRLQRTELFDPDDGAAAHARFAELAAVHASAPGVARRAVRPNAASAELERLDRLVAARDLDGIAQAFADLVETVHRPLGITWDRAGAMASFRLLLDSGHFAYRHEPLATLGDVLALSRQTIASTGMRREDFDIGALENDYLWLSEVNEHGRRVRSESFGGDQLGSAVARLYERHAELLAGTVDGPRTATIAAAVAAVVAMRPEAIEPSLAPDVRFTDHRTLGLGRSRGAERYLRGVRSLVEATHGARNEDRDVLAASERVLVLQRSTTGVDRASGGAFELHVVMLWAFGEDGRISDVELFDAEQADAALARSRVLDAEPGSRVAGVTPDAALAPPAGRASRFVPDTGAIRAARRMHEALLALDWPAWQALYADGFRNVDRRREALLESDLEAYLAAIRPMFEDFRTVDPETSPLATRGERLMLARLCMRWDGHQSGPSALEWLAVLEYDEHGRHSLHVGLDLGDVDAAYAELDARWLEGEGRRHPAVQAAMRRFADALSRRDWEALAASLSPDLFVADHRRLGWEPLHDRAAYLTALQGLFELAPDTRMRLDHVETVASGFLVCAVWTGTRDGGAFEEPSLIVGEVGRDGRMRRFDEYDVEQLDAARSRLAAVAAVDAPDPLARWLRPNAAIAAHDRFAAAIAAGDPVAMRAAFAADGVVDDRRALFRGVIDADSAVVAMGGAAVSADARGLHIVGRLVAVFGERIALQHQLWTGGPEAAPYEVEMLAVIEADRDGRIARVTSFDCDDRRAAFREADARWARLEPAFAPLLEASAAYFDATAARDAEAVRAVLADDVVVHSRRRTGTGLLEGADAYLQSLRAIWELTRASEAEVLVRLAIAPSGSVAISRVAGRLHDGGPFETLACTVVLIESGRFTHFEQFEIEDAERALERFAEVSAGEERAASDPLRIPPNAAVRVGERLRMLAAGGQWDALRAGCVPGFVFDDRRSLVRMTGGLDTFVANGRHIPRAVWQHTRRTLLATSGDRLALHAYAWRGHDGSDFEVDNLGVTEVDADERLVAVVVFDAGDRHAAAVEMLERYMTGEGAASMPPAQIAFLRALHARDLRAVRAALGDDFVFVDHRGTGSGRTADADAYVASLAAVFEQTTELATEVLYHVAVAEHGSMSVGRLFGTLRDGGGAFESPFVCINRYESGRNVGVELFEIDDLERAKARFAQLGMQHAALLAAPHVARSGAWRARDRWGACVEAGDWEGLRAVLAPDLAWEDRRRLIGMSGGRDTVLDMVRLAVSVRLFPVRTAVIAAPHDRVLLLRQVFQRGEGEAAVQIEMLQLTEVDAGARIVAIVWFDADDEPAAIAEAERRAAAASIA